MTGRLALAIDASTYAGSVALVRDREIVIERVLAMRGDRSERLLPTVAAVLEGAGVRTVDLERIVCGGGPGSFTSLRVAASIAKGIALGADRPLFALSSLLLTVAGAPGTVAPGRYLAALDAMRGEAFVAAYEVTDTGPIVEVYPPALVAGDGVDELAQRLEARVVGPNRSLDFHPHARGVARVGDWLERSSAVDLVSWEPDYGRLAEAQVRWEATHKRRLGEP